MESYIVRIVRRKELAAGRNADLDGVVENSEGNVRLPFHNPEELWSILVAASKTKRPDNTGGNKKVR